MAVESTADIDLQTDGEVDGQDLDVEDSSISRQWHEAAYILGIKEKHVLGQVAVDEILSTTSVFVDVLTGIMDDIRGSIPTDAMHILEEKVKETNDALFKDISTAFLQK